MHKTVFFNDWIREWLNEKSKYVKESSLALYRLNIRAHLIPYWGETNMREITDDMIQTYVRQLSGEGKSPRTIRNILTILTGSLNHAMVKGVIRSKKFHPVFPSSDTEKNQDVFSVREQKRLTEAIESSENSKVLGIALCLFTGIRIGELCGLRWGDVDMENRVISVTQTIQRVVAGEKTRLLISSPKTRTSLRKIPISDRLFSLLRSFTTEVPEHYVLTSSPRPTEPAVYRRFFNAFLKKNGIRKVKFHALRHTFATNCVNGGAEYKTLSSILGHSRIGTTLNLYVHPQMEQKRACVELAADILK
ncbi:MAG: site-specific integrase [Fusobacteriaceae bacterium]|jgi:integrase|nr:site-specific integrase [Fusobacteriaceae bacterium]